VMSMQKNLWLLYQNQKLSSNWMILWEQWGTNTWQLLTSAALQTRMISGSVPGQISQNTVNVIIRKPQRCEIYFHGIKHRICFFIKLHPLALDNNRYGSVMLRIDQHSCWLLTCKGMDRTFNFRYFAGNTVHLIPVQKC